MPDKIFYLATCDTCREIRKDIIGPQKGKGFELQDIKTEPLTGEQVDALKERAGSYEALFSRRSQQFQKLKLGEKHLTEADYRHYLLEHYTFLKRPVIDYQGQLFIGSEKKTLEALKEALK